MFKNFLSVEVCYNVISMSLEMDRVVHVLFIRSINCHSGVSFHFLLKVKRRVTVYSSLLLYGITQCYLPPDTDERALH